MIRPMTCPICEKNLPPEITGESAEFPFCSVRCKQVDLHRWLNGEYACVEPLSIDDISETPNRMDAESDPPSENWNS